MIAAKSALACGGCLGTRRAVDDPPNGANDDASNQAPGTASTLLTNLAKSGEVTKADRALKPPE